jgi:hypothetical protein
MIGACARSGGTADYDVVVVKMRKVAESLCEQGLRDADTLMRACARSTFVGSKVSWVTADGEKLTVRGYSRAPSVLNRGITARS